MAGKAKAAKTVMEIFSDFIEPLVSTGATKYGKALISNPFAGRTGRQAVMKAFDDPAFISRIRGESSAGLIGTKSEFGDAVRPILKEVASSLGSSPKSSSSAALAAISKPNVQKLGTSQVSGFIDPKGKADLDGYTLALLREGKYSEAIDHLYKQTQNLGALTPQSFVESAVKRGGKSAFYPLRSQRNSSIAKELDLPQRLIGRMSSPASAQAGPALEEARLISVIPFIRVGKNGLPVFDYKAAQKTLGPAFIDEPGIKGTIDQALYYANNPDYLNSIESGLKSKTWPYDILEADPYNPLAYVSDTVDTVMRGGGASAVLPSNTGQAIVGQVPGRYLAMKLGLEPAPTQEIPWIVGRIAGNEIASTNPFTTLPPSAIRRIASGTELPNLSGARSSNFPATAPFSGQPGLVDSEFRAMANEAEKAFERAVRKNPQDYPLYEVLPSGVVIPNRTSAQSIILPSDRDRFGGPVATMLQQLGSTIQ